MKWIKHLSATRRDERVARLIAKHGMVAYGLYWAVQEIIADQMEGPNPSCRVSYPVSMWAHQLSINPPSTRKMLQWLADAGLMELSYGDDEIVITNTKLLKYRDEYSRKSGQTPDKVAPDIEADKERDKKEKVPPPKAPPSSWLLPSWIDRQAWTGFEEMRRKIRAPLTDRARDGIVKELQKLCSVGSDGADILDQSIRNSYRGVFPLKETGNGSHSNGNGRYLSKGERGQQAYEQVVAEILAEDRGSSEAGGNDARRGNGGGIAPGLLQALGAGKS